MLLAAGGCAIQPDERAALGTGETIELADTPFFPQARYQCGPAALATVLTASGINTTAQALVPRVYLPARRGSLQAELLATTRALGRLPYVIDSELQAVQRALAAGRPVLVLQNLGVAMIPRWHYAVIVGIDAEGGQVILRSGTEERRMTPLRTFMKTWRRGDYWGMVALVPGELPAGVNRDRYADAVVALEQAGRHDSALAAWQAALDRWPDDTLALFGLANAYLALERYGPAEAAYRQLLAMGANSTAVRNNLALTLAGLGRYDEALSQVRMGIDSNTDPRLETELKDTEAGILRSRAEYP